MIVNALLRIIGLSGVNQSQLLAAAAPSDAVIVMIEIGIRDDFLAVCFIRGFPVLILQGSLRSKN